MLILALTIAVALQAPATGDFGSLRDRWTSDLHEKHVEASIAAYEPDAEFIEPTGERVRGTDALRTLFGNITQTFDSDLKFTSVRVEVSGDLAYDSGTFKETLVTRATGMRIESTGSYLTVYRRSTEGVWLIAEQVWTGAPVKVPSSPAK